MNVVYLCNVQPLVRIFDNRIEIFNTWYAGLLFCFSFVFTDLIDSVELQESLGNYMIYGIGLYILVNFYKITTGVGRDLTLLGIKVYRIVVWKCFKWKTKRN